MNNKCDTCRCNSVCDHNKYGFENCDNYIPDLSTFDFAEKDLIKALECCIKSTHFGECFENKCPFISEAGCEVGEEGLYPYLLEVVKKLKEENKKLTEPCEVLTPKNTKDLYAIFRKEIDKYAIPLIVDDFLEFIELVRVDGEIVGMCGGADGYIDCLYVLPKHRRQGYAKKLALDWYGRYGRGEKATRLHIVNNNVPALKFWNSIFELKEIECSVVDTLYEIVRVKE